LASDDSQRPFLLVGLGNPGIEYQWTPHNAGFLAIDRLAARLGVTVANRRCKSLTATGHLAGRPVVLAKPETWMNLSGLAVSALVREFDAEPAGDLLVLYDELDLPLGSLRVREHGSPAGHNGARSISGALRSDEWARIRIGVNPASGASGVEGARRHGKDYLLATMRRSDLALLDEVLDRVAEAAETVIAQGIGPAMNQFNRRERPPSGAPSAASQA
jgi:PTH1 family peptidyl-tRNA hydrolase